jgi:hypothetical protein
LTFIIYFASVGKYCDCPGSKEGRIIVDPKAHLPNCRFRRKISSNRYCVDTSVTPADFKDGYGLGVAI